jgi:hypothetical protein
MLPAAVQENWAAPAYGSGIMLINDVIQCSWHYCPKAAGDAARVIFNGNRRMRLCLFLLLLSE